MVRRETKALADDLSKEVVDGGRQCREVEEAVTLLRRGARPSRFSAAQGGWLKDGNFMATARPGNATRARWTWSNG